MWAWNFGGNYGNEDVTIWFDNSATQLSDIKIYFENGQYSQDYSFSQIAGTDYWTITTHYAGYNKYEIHGTPKNSSDNWGWKTNAKGSGEEVYSGWYARCFSPSATSGQAGSWTVPGQKSVSYTRNSTTTTNTLAGSGTSGSPYIIKPGTAIGVELSGTAIDANCTKYYKFGSDAASTTNTNQLVASCVVGTTYSMEGYTGAKRDTYESRYASAGTLYFKAAYTISAAVSGENGSVSITSGGNYVYTGNTSFTVTATPDSGYEVDTWTVTEGTKTGSGNSITVSASNSGNCTVTVTFALPCATVVVLADVTVIATVLFESSFADNVPAMKFVPLILAFVAPPSLSVPFVALKFPPLLFFTKFDNAVVLFTYTVLLSAAIVFAFFFTVIVISLLVPLYLSLPASVAVTTTV